MTGRSPRPRLKPRLTARLRRVASGGADSGGRAAAGDSGTAIVEFVFVAVLVMVPLVYLLVAVAVVQRSEVGVTDAAREGGRAFATSDTPGQAEVRMAAAVRLALDAQGLPDDVEVRAVAAGSSCAAPAIRPTLEPGAQFVICVRRRVQVPAVPSILGGRGITTVGRYAVHVDDFRTVG